MKKKSNPYKIEDVMLKHSITRDEAILKIKELDNILIDKLKQYEH